MGGIAGAATATGWARLKKQAWAGTAAQNKSMRNKQKPRFMLSVSVAV